MLRVSPISLRHGRSGYLATTSEKGLAEESRRGSEKGLASASEIIAATSGCSSRPSPKSGVADAGLFAETTTGEISAVSSCGPLETAVGRQKRRAISSLLGASLAGRGSPTTKIEESTRVIGGPSLCRSGL